MRLSRRFVIAARVETAGGEVVAKSRLSRLSLGVIVVTLTSASCAPKMSDEERARIARVRVVSSQDVVRGCEPIGSVTDDDIQDLQKKAARLGGDVALVTLQSQGARGGFGRGGGGFRYSTYTTAEVYRCGSQQ